MIDHIREAFDDLIAPTLPGPVRGDAKRPRRTHTREGFPGLIDAARDAANPDRTQAGLVQAADAVHVSTRRAVTKSIGRDPGQATLEPFRQAFVRKNVALIRDLSIDTAHRLEATVGSAIARGLTGSALAEELQTIFGLHRSRARLIARDQILKAASQLTQSHHKAAGVSEYIWTASGDERVRDRHAELDGTRHSYSAPPVVDDYGRRAHPGEDYYCRCTAFPVIPSDVFG